ncbi:MAG: DUF1275 family protein [Planctomycetes bacterium]|nr:DUF1275 family protein [Planctomycetota bacterium]
MFRAQAHSFQQQARLAISLSWVAGYTNALTVLTCDQVTSHMTGAVSHVGVELVDGRYPHAVYLLGLIGVFLLGAFSSGVLTEFGRLRRFESIYVLPMMVEAVTLGVFALLVDWQAIGQIGDGAQVWLTYLPAYAMGLQNATITRISGGVIRTTHVTGVITDLGLETSKLVFRLLGWKRRLDERRAAQERWRALLLLTIPASFGLGAALGTFAFGYVQAWSMVPAVLFLFFLTLQDILVPIAAVELREGSHDGAPIIAIYHAEPPADRGRMRLPDLTTWASAIDPHVRIVVLDLGNLPEFGERSALELRALMLHLREEGRELVLAGVGKQQIANLQHAGVLLDFDADDLCSDLHSAAVRAEQLAEALAPAR